jgi:hypothetical protein
MARYSREELQEAHDHFVGVAGACAQSGEWRPWADLFTPDAEYLEHTFGRFHGPDEIYAWIQGLMSQWPNSEMTSFPHDWCVCDEERGWWICQIENRFRDPGDHKTYQAHNLTVLHYAGDNKWSYEEDAYNPTNFIPMVNEWIAAVSAHEGER